MKSTRKLFILFAALSISLNSFAQNWGSNPPSEPTKEGPRKPTHEKKTFQDAENNIYWQVDLPVYINISTGPAEKGDHYQMKNVKSASMETHANPMYFDGHGEHYIRHHDYENRIPEKEVAFKVYVDGLSPNTQIKYSGAPMYLSKGAMYYGKGLTGVLTAQDQMSGLDQILYSINGADYKTYSASISFPEEKSYTHQYYSVDKVGNVEKEHMDEFIVDLTAPETSYDLSGKRLENIFSSKVLVRLQATDKLSGVKMISWKLDGGDDDLYDSPIKLAYLDDGTHTLTYSSVDQVSNEEVAKKLEFYLDKIAPVVKSKIEGDVFRGNGKTYISGRTLISLTATDNKAGVESISYRINGKNEKIYGDPFKIEGYQGPYKIDYRGLDKVDNRGLHASDDDLGNLFLDLTPPTVDHEYEGPKFETRDTTFITSETLVKIIANDHQSGIKTLNYKLDETETAFEKPFQVKEDGLHDVLYYAIDQVNNRAENDFFFIVDNIGPEIFHHFSMKEIGMAKMDDEGGDIPIYSPHNLLYLAATDNAVGTNQIYYSLDEENEKLYAGPIKYLRKGYHTLIVRAVDYLGNETTSEKIHFMIK